MDGSPDFSTSNCGNIESDCVKLDPKACIQFKVLLYFIKHYKIQILQSFYKIAIYLKIRNFIYLKFILNKKYVIILKILNFKNNYLFIKIISDL